MQKKRKKNNKNDTSFCAGTVTPLSFLRTKNSLGIGNISDLKLLIELAKTHGESIIQLLPLNDTGNKYLWPYSAISSFAINPVYIDVRLVFEQYKSELSWNMICSYTELINQAMRNESHTQIQYEKIRIHILKILRLLFTELEPKLNAKLKTFEQKNPWVLDYALFLTLSERHEQYAWYDWAENGLRNHNAQSLKTFYQKNREKIQFYIFCQKIALDQLIEIKNFANKNRIKIKGDIPILVDRNSADVWANPNLFHLNYSAGAPPDMFTIGGQEWGSPPLNLSKPEATDYFISRFKFGSNYMNMVRIDHVLGLFRLMIWNPSIGNIANYGFFYPQADTQTQTAITRAELENIRINPDIFTQKIGVVTDLCDLKQKAADICVKCGFAKWIQDSNQLAWISDPIVSGTDTIHKEGWYNYPHTLNNNDDKIWKALNDNDLNKDAIWSVINARRKLQNMLGNYLNDPNLFFVPTFFRETWHYINLDEWQKSALETLLKKKQDQQYAFWEKTGKKILSRLQNETNLDLFAEDLGKVDPYIPEVLKELNIPGINILRWCPTFNKNHQRELAVLTPSTHDTSTFQQWWHELDEDWQTKKQVLNDFLNIEVDIIPKVLSKQTLKEIFLSFYSANANYIIMPFWEILYAFYNEPDKRMNTPGQNSPDNWCARMEKPLETYLTKDKTAKKIYIAVKKSGRLT